ncbi:hypothetical protein D9M73_285520 [compost metagenome]
MLRLAKKQTGAGGDQRRLRVVEGFETAAGSEQLRLVAQGAGMFQGLGIIVIGMHDKTALQQKTRVSARAAADIHGNVACICGDQVNRLTQVRVHRSLA